MKIKCLIVEDALFLREVYRYNLKNENVEIIDEAADGEEALLKIARYQPELVILDMILPLKNGLEVLKEMSVISPRSKCLVISSMDNDGVIQTALALGAIKFLKKPFTKTDLMAAIHEVSRHYNEVQNG